MAKRTSTAEAANCRGERNAVPKHCATQKRCLAAVSTLVSLDLLVSVRILAVRPLTPSVVCLLANIALISWLRRAQAFREIHARELARFRRCG